MGGFHSLLTSAATIVADEVTRRGVGEVSRTQTSDAWELLLQPPDVGCYDCRRVRGLHWELGTFPGCGHAWGMPLRTRVKICGLTRAEDVDAAVEAGADAVGFVFVAGTPRVVSVERARALRTRVPPFVTVVGLFVNADPVEVRETVSAVRLDVIQLHGEETPEVAGICGQWAQVVKAFRMKGPETLDLMPAYAAAAQAYLVDAYVAGAHGGTGARFDWDLAIRAQALGKPVILAGGLKPGNAAEAVRRVGAYALDVSSGVESAPGLKDPERIRSFMDAVRG